jgi:hypothetical protein
MEKASGSVIPNLKVILVRTSFSSIDSVCQGRQVVEESIAKGDAAIPLTIARIVAISFHVGLSAIIW